MKVYIVQAVEGPGLFHGHASAPRQVSRHNLCVFETESLAREYVKKHQSKFRGTSGYLEIHSWDVLNKVD